MVKALIISNIRSNWRLTPLLEIYIIFNKIDLVFLLGNVVSPNIVYRLSRRFSGRVYGLTGNLDDSSVIEAFRDTGGYLEGSIIEFDNIFFGGIGSSIQTSISRLKKRKINVLLSFYPGVKYGCREYGVDYIDRLIDSIKPNLIVFGDCNNQFFRDNIVACGEGFKGYLVIIEYSDNSYNVFLDNLYDFLEKLHKHNESGISET